MAVFPVGLDVFPDADTMHAGTLGTSPHSSLHEDLGLALAAAQAKIGIDGSAETDSLDYLVASLLADVAALQATITGSGVLVPTGVIMEFGGSVAPSGFLLCDGTSYLRATYPALFTAIGTVNGATDGSHFNVPNHINRVGVGAGGTYARGATGGAATVTLSSAQIPAHTHVQNSHTHGVGNDSTGWVADGTTGGVSLANVDATGASYILKPLTAATTAVNQNTGGGGSHENMPPYIGVTYIIKT